MFYCFKNLGVRFWPLHCCILAKYGDSPKNQKVKERTRGSRKPGKRGIIFSFVNYVHLNYLSFQVSMDLKINIIDKINILLDYKYILRVFSQKSEMKWFTFILNPCPLDENERVKWFTWSKKKKATKHMGWQLKVCDFSES